MKIHDVEQGSVEWLLLRSTMPTASEFDALVSPLGKVRTGEGPATYLAKKVAEAWQGGPLPSFSSYATEQGTILESADAVPWFEFEFNTTVRRVGFITTDDGKCGCSPDGLLDDDCGLEIKAPQAHTHTRYLLDGVLPSDYVLQVQGSMFVTGFKRWKFLSWRRGFPPLLLTIERDEKIQAAIREALDAFNVKFAEAMAKMTTANGGKGPRRLTPMPEKPKPKQTTEEIVAGVEMLN